MSRPISKVSLFSISCNIGAMCVYEKQLVTVGVVLPIPLPFLSQSIVKSSPQLTYHSTNPPSAKAKHLSVLTTSLKTARSIACEQYLNVLLRLHFLRTISYLMINHSGNGFAHHTTPNNKQHTYNTDHVVFWHQPLFGGSKERSPSL